MSTCRVILRLDGDRARYLPGDTLAGDCRVDTVEPGNVAAVELSVLWYTEGTGDEDFAVHFFERMEFDEDEAPSPPLMQRFAMRLPNSPLSYDGLIVKLHWCVRARVFLREGKDALAEAPFQLGDVPSAREVQAPLDANAEDDRHAEW